MYFMHENKIYSIGINLLFLLLICSCESLTNEHKDKKFAPLNDSEMKLKEIDITGEWYVQSIVFGVTKLNVSNNKNDYHDLAFCKNRNDSIILLFTNDNLVIYNKDTIGTWSTTLLKGYTFGELILKKDNRFIYVDSPIPLDVKYSISKIFDFRLKLNQYFEYTENGTSIKLQYFLRRTKSSSNSSPQPVNYEAR